MTTGITSRGPLTDYFSLTNHDRSRLPATRVNSSVALSMVAGNTPVAMASFSSVADCP